MMKPATSRAVTGHLADVVTTAFAGFEANVTRAQTTGQLVGVASQPLRAAGSNPARRRSTASSAGAPTK